MTILRILLASLMAHSNHHIYIVALINFWKKTRFMILAQSLPNEWTLLVRGRAELRRRRAVLHDPSLLRVQTLLERMPRRFRVIIVQHLRLLCYAIQDCFVVE